MGHQVVVVHDAVGSFSHWRVNQSSRWAVATKSRRQTAPADAPEGAAGGALRQYRGKFVVPDARLPEGVERARDVEAVQQVGRAERSLWVMWLGGGGGGLSVSIQTRNIAVSFSFHEKQRTAAPPRLWPVMKRE